jgi:hypothetical protein
MKKKMEIKQHAHVVKTMAPYPFMGMLWYWNMWNVGKDKRFVYCCQFLGLKFLFMRRFFKINSMQKRCEIKVLCEAHCILLTIVQRLYTH